MKYDTIIYPDFVDSVDYKKNLNTKKIKVNRVHTDIVDNSKQREKSLPEYIDVLLEDEELYYKFCLAYAATAHYFAQYDGMLSPQEKEFENKFLEMFFSNGSLSEDDKRDITELFDDTSLVFFKVRKYLDEVTEEGLVLLKKCVEEMISIDGNVAEAEKVAYDKFMSYYDERTDKWHKDRTQNFEFDIPKISK